MVVLFCQKIAVSCNCQEIQIIFIKSLVYEARGLRNSITTYNMDVPARSDQNLPHSLIYRRPPSGMYQTTSQEAFSIFRSNF